MTLRIALILCAAMAAPVAAEPMSAAEFEAYVTGKTLFYGRDGRSYGAEIYRENRRVTWSFLDGECKDGYWYNEGRNICFVYEDRPGDPQCWSFEQQGGGLVATFENDPASTELYEAQDVGEEMVCLGPKIGV
ncbi:hypothetical protein [uncultured Tateyamaria sp.]|uniref:hypothetical protein n=1 Tax=uncultured Tateyamaria sp. TaxID=455651 RepID=UPI002611FDB6|nr:hypothetical protein [uncultured Tateyamaria sp.]